LSQTETELAERPVQPGWQDATTRIFVALVVICLLLALLDQVWPTTDNYLRYERGAVLRGEWWRLLPGHLVHGDAQHLLFNMLGTVLVAALFPQTYTVGRWLTVLLVSAGAIDLGFLVFDPGLEWYVGISGVLHGALAAGAVAWWRTRRRGLACALTLFLIGKLLWEQLHGSLPLVTGLPVIVGAHLYGVIGGVIAALCVGFPWNRRTGRASL
jgi:rhomboid family GlyGly-CTERM serine protease